jgi:hypothetical protein
MRNVTCIQVFQKLLYQKARYKTHLPLKYCITKMCARVLAPSSNIALTQKHVSTRLKKFQLGLQFVTKQNYSFLLGKATFGHTV